MGDRHKRHRVFVEDARRNGSYLRATWHPERRVFTISTWTGEVCTGAVRVPASQAPELVGLVVDGLAELAIPQDAPVAARPPAPSAPARSPLDALRHWLRTRTAVLAPALPLRSPPGPASPQAEDEQTA
jgi:hypothetical protein